MSSFQHYLERIECLMLPVVEDSLHSLPPGLPLCRLFSTRHTFWRWSTEGAAMGQRLDLQMRIARDRCLRTLTRRRIADYGRLFSPA
jgi:hypothetical protein